MYFLIFLFYVFPVYDGKNSLFAGNGIQTYSYTDDGKVIDFGCNTYDDCHEFLCVFLTDPTFYLTIIKPYNWDGNCSELDAFDDRSLSAELDVYSGNKMINWYIFGNMSQASILLCELNKNKNITEMDYYGSGPGSC